MIVGGRWWFVGWIAFSAVIIYEAAYGRLSPPDEDDD